MQGLVLKWLSPTCTASGRRPNAEVLFAGYFIDPALQQESFDLAGLADSNLQETAGERKTRIQAYVRRIDVQAICVPCSCNGTVDVNPDVCVPWKAHDNAQEYCRSA